MSKLVPPMSTATKSPSAGALGGERRAHHATGRAGREQRDRAAGDVVGRHHPAGRLHDQQRPAVARAPELVLELAGVVRDARRDVRVHERGRHPFELGPARHHLVRQRDVFDVGELLEHDLARAPLVLRVHEREQVHHRDRAHAELLQALHAAPHGVLVERQQRPSPSKFTRSGIGMRARRRAIGVGPGIVRVPDLFLVAAPQLDLVAVALGDEQAR